MTTSSNRDDRVIEGFGREWSTFDQSGVPPEERGEIFGQYFAIFPWNLLGPEATGADIGCGSGRWALEVARRVKHLHCVDPSSEALDVARESCKDAAVTFHEASVDALPFAPASLDFAYSLGVLHHVPDTPAALRSCAEVLKPGAPFLCYLYYAFDNRPAWFRSLWKASDMVRRGLSRAPFGVRVRVTGVIAACVYLPMARLARLLERLGVDVTAVPLSYYRRRSFYVMRNDALDRFGTLLEQRFTRAQIASMLEQAGFGSVQFSPSAPYWTVLALRR